MRKIFIFIFIICSISAHSQTWSETSGFGGRYTEWTVITRDDWQRLVRQNQEDGSGCDIIYTDNFEIREGSKVLSGVRPSFNGYYFLYGKYYGFNDFIDLGWFPVLAYGNSNTGRMEIKYSWLSSMEAGSNEYINLYNRFIRRVNGE